MKRRELPDGARGALIVHAAGMALAVVGSVMIRHLDGAAKRPCSTFVAMSIYPQGKYCEVCSWHREAHEAEQTSNEGAKQEDAAPTPDELRFVAGRLHQRATLGDDNLLQGATAILLFAADELERLAYRVDAARTTQEARVAEQRSAALDPREEPFCGRFWGLVNVEGDEPRPLIMFRVEVDAQAELTRRRGLDGDGDDYLGDGYDVLPYDVEALFWNSYEPNPRPAPTTSRLWDMQQEIERLGADLARFKAGPPPDADMMCEALHDVGIERDALKAEIARMWPVVTAAIDDAYNGSGTLALQVAVEYYERAVKAGGAL